MVSDRHTNHHTAEGAFDAANQARYLMPMVMADGHAKAVRIYAARDSKDVSHVRSSRRHSACVASTNPTRLRPPAAAKPSPRASQFHPSITSERTASMR